MFCGPGLAKTLVFTQFFACCQKLFLDAKGTKTFVNYTIFTRGQYQKNMKIDQKTAQQGPPKRIFKFYPLFSHPEPPKTWKPQQAEGF